MVPKGSSLGHDDFFVETARGADEKEDAYGKESESIEPEMMNGGPAKDDGARDVDEIAGWDEIADHVKHFGHRFAREDVPGEKDAWQNGQESQLHGLGLGVGFTGDEDAQRE